MQGGFSRTVLNTLILTSSTILVVLVIGGLGAFALARFRFAGANALSFYLLVGTSMPALLFMVPLYFMFLQDANLKPISTSVLSFQTRYSRDWGLTSAASMILIIPVVILFLSLQRQFIEGLARGGLKG